MSNFLTKLTISNSKQNLSTGECILTVPVLELDDKYEIKPENDFFLSSNCNTVIKCTKITITSKKKVSISNINFEAQVTIEGSKNVTISNSKITKAKNGKGALAVYNTELATFSHITVTDIDKIPGIYISLHSNVKADNIFIHDLSDTLLVCNNESTLLLRDSNLRNSKANGIYSSLQSKLEIRGCNIESTEYPSIFLSGSSGKIINNTIRDVKQNAILIYSSKDSEFIGNEITEVAGSAITFLDNSSGKAHKNLIYCIKGNGIYVSDSSEVEVTENEISQNGCPGIAVLMKSNATVSKNKVYKTMHNGIYVSDASNVKITECSIRDISECGILISDTDNCIVARNVIEDCKIAAVEAYNGSKVNITCNKINNIQEYAFLVYTSAFITAQANKINHIGKAIVKLLYKGGGDFINNYIINCPLQKEGHTSSQYFLSDNGKFPSITNVESKISSKVSMDKDHIVDVNLLCIKCNKKLRNCFLLNCGHKAYCKECSEEALKNKEACPLCRFPITKITSSYVASSKQNMCCHCLKNKPNCLITPCGHMGICKDCLEKWYKTSKCCPICRIEPSNFTVIKEIYE